MRILVLDDHEEAADSLSALLMEAGHEVTTVYGGLDAINAMGGRGYDLAILDLSMPGVDGYIAGKWVKAARPATIVVALSALSQPEHRGRTNAMGFDFHLPKPLDLGALERIMQSVGPG